MDVSEIQTQLERLIEQRHSTRFDTHLNAVVVNDWQERAQGVVTNISRAGIRLEGKRGLVDTIFPNFNSARPAPQRGIRLLVALHEGARLSADNQIELVCNSVYVSRVQADWFQLGLCYQQIDAAVSQRLEAFIVELENAQPGRD